MSVGFNPAQHNNLPSPSGNQPHGLISASRLQLDPQQVAKASEGDSLRPVHTGLLPSTGIVPLDETAKRVNTVAEYAPDAVTTTYSSALRGGLYGGTCGLIIGLASQGIGIIGDLFARRTPGGAVVAALFTGAGALIGSALGLFNSGKKSAEDLKNLLYQ